MLWNSKTKEDIRSEKNKLYEKYKKNKILLNGNGIF